jgi:hypothetical protein
VADNLNKCVLATWRSVLRSSILATNVKGCLKGKSSEILIQFYYFNRHRPEYEPLRVLKFAKGPPHNFITEIAFFARLRRIYIFRKDYIFKKVFTNSRKLF